MSVRFRAALLGLSTAATASAVTVYSRHYPASLCNPATPADGAKISITNNGVHNTATSAATIHCGAMEDYYEATNSMRVTMYDRHATQDVCCTMQLLSGNGLVMYTGNVCSTGNSASLQDKWHNFAWPSSGTPNMVCTIPPVGSGYSHVVAYSTATQKP